MTLVVASVVTLTTGVQARAIPLSLIGEAEARSNLYSSARPAGPATVRRQSPAGILSGKLAPENGMKLKRWPDSPMKAVDVVPTSGSHCCPPLLGFVTVR